jgi:hypothetical protein
MYTSFGDTISMCACIRLMGYAQVTITSKSAAHPCFR